MTDNLRAAADAIGRFKTDILSRWKERVLAEVPPARTVSQPALFDSLPHFLDQLAADLRSPAATLGREGRRIAQFHGQERATLAGYDLSQVIHEYILLRQVIFEILPNSDDAQVIGRIHDAIDQGIRYGSSEYVRIVGRDRDSALDDSRRIESELETEHVKLNASQGDLVDTIESMSDAFFSVDRDWTITRVNAKLLAVAGRRREDLVGHKFPDAFLPGTEDRRDQYWAHYKRALQEQISVSFEEYYEPLDLWTRVRAYPKQGGGLAVFFSDITAGKRVEKTLIESSERLQAVIDTIPMFAGVIDVEGRVLMVNQLALDVVGSTKAQEVGRFFWDALWWSRTAGATQILKDALARALEGTPSRFDSPFWALEREACVQRWLDFSMTPIVDADSSIREITVAGFDITERRQQSRELELARANAEAANETKSMFLANMSHEIRSPVGAIMGFADLMKAGDLSKADIASFLSVIDRNSHHLLRVIDDILDLSKVEAGKMVIERIDFSLVELLADFSSFMGFRAREKGIEFELRAVKPVPDVINTDPTRLRQILNNVVGNAIKFTDHGRVQVDVGYEDNVFEVVVTDTGPGISPEQIETLFKPFAQADVSTTRRFGGTGLGLVLTRNLAEALGGEFTLERSQPGEGSVFRARVQVSPGREARLLASEDLSFVTRPPVPAARAGGLLDGLNVLVVEDSPDNQVLFSLILNRAGAHVDLADNGVEGVERALAKTYDVVLMDIQMPRMDGHEAMRVLRAKKYDVPVIALTAHAMKAERERASVSGFVDYVSKPVQRDELIAKILAFTKASAK